MRVTVHSNFVMKFTVFVLIIGTHALPQWFNGLRRDLAYAPAAYNPEYGPRNGGGGYSYGGYGPQPTVVTTPSFTSSSSETHGTCIRSQAYAYSY
jgi:hypothetical protein